MILIPRHTHSSEQVGLDAAGKTTTLYKLKLGEVVSTIPTIGEHLIFSPSCGLFLSIFLTLSHFVWVSLSLDYE